MLVNELLYIHFVKLQMPWLINYMCAYFFNLKYSNSSLSDGFQHKQQLNSNFKNTNSIGRVFSIELYRYWICTCLSSAHTLWLVSSMECGWDRIVQTMNATEIWNNVRRYNTRNNSNNSGDNSGNNKRILVLWVGRVWPIDCVVYLLLCGRTDTITSLDNMELDAVDLSQGPQLWFNVSTRCD